MKNTPHLTQKEIITILAWFKAYIHEVDLTTKDYALFKKFAPLLPGRFKGIIEDIDKRYNDMRNEA